MAQIHAVAGDIIDIRPLGPALREQVTTRSSSPISSS